MIRNALLIALAVISLAACTMIPQYTRPAPPIPADWPSGPAYTDVGDGRTDQPVARIEWRDFYRSEQLRKLIELALANNRDLRIATLNIERVQALYRVQRADLFPT